MEGTHSEDTITAASRPALIPNNDSVSSLPYVKEKPIIAARPPFARMSLVPNDSSSSLPYVKKKQHDSWVEVADDEKTETYMHALEVAEPEYRNGVQVIQTGLDVSRFVVDVRDDGDEALTFRSIFLGTVFAGMGAALCQASTPITYYYPRSN